MVVTSRNYDEVPAVLELARNLGVNSFTHYHYIPTGRGKDDFDTDLTPTQREELLNLLVDYHMRRRETGLNVISTAPQYARVIWERSGRKSAGFFHYTADNTTSITGIIEYAGGCGAGRVYAAVQPNGRMTPCVFMPDVTIGYIREAPFIDIWQNSETCLEMVDRDNYHYQCPTYKNICGGCRARAFAYGDLIGPDPRCAVYQKVMGMRDEYSAKREAVAV
jgi:radical SAM protein with 4Fe4S-binding SPASM domain